MSRGVQSAATQVSVFRMGSMEVLSELGWALSVVLSQPHIVTIHWYWLRPASHAVYMYLRGAAVP